MVKSGAGDGLDTAAHAGVAPPPDGADVDDDADGLSTATVVPALLKSEQGKVKPQNPEEEDDEDDENDDESDEDVIVADNRAHMASRLFAVLSPPR